MPTSPPARRPLSGLHDVDAAAAQHAQVVLHGGVLPHLGVHGRAHQDRRPGGEQDVGEQVVADAGGVEARGPGGGGRDEHQVGRLAEVGVRDRVGFVPQRRPRSLRGEGVEGGSPTKWRAPSVRTGITCAPGVDEPTADLDRLVGGDAPGDAEDDALALEHGAWVESTYSAGSEPSPSASSPSASGSGQ